MKPELLLNPETVARALLLKTRGLGRGSLQRILESFGSIIPLFESPDRLDHKTVPGINKKLISLVQTNLEKWNIEKAIDRLKKQGIGLVGRNDPQYPKLLAETYSPPELLFYRGDLALLDKPSVAIVGTRNCSAAGREIAFKLAAGLGEIGVVVISGLAAGIDTAAHRGAMQTGQTVAVLGTGLNRPYPARNRQLHQQLAKSNLIVSEYSPETGPHPRNFPARNRIISGLSKAVLVVQAAERSGALITADFALEQGRDVYAVPGAVGDFRHRGCHMLIKQGAGLVEEVEDIIDYLHLQSDFIVEQQTVTISLLAGHVLDLIGFKPLHLDQLVESLENSLGEIACALLELEKKHLIISLPGQRYQKSQDVRHLKIESSQTGEKQL